MPQKSAKERILASLRSEGKPICDRCLIALSGLKYPSHTSMACCALSDDGQIQRGLGICRICRKLLLVNSIKDLPATIVKAKIRAGTTADRVLKLLGELQAPLCDDCLTETAKLTQRPQANTVSRFLYDRGLSQRGKAKCSLCGKTKTGSWALDMPTPQPVAPRADKSKLVQRASPVEEELAEDDSP